MPRVKRGNKRRERRKKLLGLAKGFFLTKGKLYRAAKEATDRAGNFAYVGRHNKKRDFPRLWIIRIKAAGIDLDRKSLAEIAARDPQAFTTLVESAKAGKVA